MANPFDPSFETLPEIIPIFPLAGALLLPRAKLPLNIFEPRYLAMTLAALGAERMIGMIQPERNGEPAPVYDIGCAGRITSFAETDDGRFLITLSGISRFTIAEELAPRDGYRRVAADYSRFRDDLSAEAAVDVERDRLLAALKAFLALKGVQANWQAIDSADDAELVTSLAMMSPFGVSEKQALLEAPDLGERARIMVTLLEMALLERDDGAGHIRQ